MNFDLSLLSDFTDSRRDSAWAGILSGTQSEADEDWTVLGRPYNPQAPVQQMINQFFVYGQQVPFQQSAVLGDFMPPPEETNNDEVDVEIEE